MIKRKLIGHALTTLTSRSFPRAPPQFGCGKAAAGTGPFAFSRFLSLQSLSHAIQSHSQTLTGGKVHEEKRRCVLHLSCIRKRVATPVSAPPPFCMNDCARSPVLQHLFADAPCTLASKRHSGLQFASTIYALRLLTKNGAGQNAVITAV